MTIFTLCLITHYRCKTSEEINIYTENYISYLILSMLLPKYHSVLGSSEVDHDKTKPTFLFISFWVRLDVFDI